MSSKRKLDLNIHEIDTILNAYYTQKISSTQISKNMKINISKVKNVIANYSETYLNRFPQYKPVGDISVDMYESHIKSKDYVPYKIEIEHIDQNQKKKDSKKKYNETTLNDNSIFE